MYSAQIMGSGFGSVGSKLKAGVKAVGKGLKAVGKAAYSVADTTKGLAVASAMCKLSNPNKDAAAKAAGVAPAKIHQFCQAAKDKDYATLALLLPEMLKILNKSPKLKEQSIDDEAAAFKKKAKPGMPLWAKIALGAGGGLLAIGIIVKIARPSGGGSRVIYTAPRQALAPAPAAAQAAA